MNFYSEKINIQIFLNFYSKFSKINFFFASFFWKTISGYTDECLSRTTVAVS